MEGYPKTKYPKVGGGSITVASPDQEKLLGDGWQDHPPFVIPDPAENIEKIFAEAVDQDQREIIANLKTPKRRGRPPKAKEGDPFEQST